MVDSYSKKLNNLKEKEAIIIERQQKVTSLETNYLRNCRTKMKNGICLSPLILALGSTHNKSKKTTEIPTDNSKSVHV